MGYTLRIGEAVVDTDFDDGARYTRVTVIPVDGLSLGAPVDSRGMEGHSNETWPSYTVWGDFAKSVGLWELFFGSEADRGAHFEYQGEVVAPLIGRAHPGAVAITPTHLVIAEAALAAYRDDQPSLQGSYRPGGYTWTEHPPDSWHKVRLEWLVWWLRWALGNCKHPTFANS